jgi:SAM-dependent methyltransferase
MLSERHSLVKVPIVDNNNATRTEPAWTAHDDIGGGGQAAFWVDEQSRFDRMLRPFGERLLDAAEIARGDRVLDVGCGTGWTTIGAAHRSAPAGRVFGADVSPTMVEAARKRAATAGLGNVAFDVADMADLAVADGSFDVVISRFAIGHAQDLSAVARGLRRALADGGRLAVMEWAPGQDNPWMAIAHPGRDRRLDGDTAHHRALDDEATLRQTFVAAGYRSVMLELMTAPLWMAHDIDDAIGAWRASPDAGARMLSAPADARALTSALRDRLARHMTPRGIEVPGTAWLITAYR